MRQNCSQLEKAMVELQGNLEGKNASLASLNNDLKVAEDQYHRLMGKVEEMQNTVTSKDNTGETCTSSYRRYLTNVQLFFSQFKPSRSTQVNPQ